MIALVQCYGKTNCVLYCSCASEPLRFISYIVLWGLGNKLSHYKNRKFCLLCFQLYNCDC